MLRLPLLAPTALILCIFPGQAAMACDSEARERSAQAIQSLAGVSSLDSEELQRVLEELCGAAGLTAQGVQREDQLEWRPVSGAQDDAAVSRAESPAYAEEDDPETTTILGMEFRKADADSEGRRRLMKKR